MKRRFVCLSQLFIISRFERLYRALKKWLNDHMNYVIIGLFSSGAILLSGTMFLLSKAWSVPITEQYLWYNWAISCVILGLCSYGIGFFFAGKRAIKEGQENRDKIKREIDLFEKQMEWYDKWLNEHKI